MIKAALVTVLAALALLCFAAPASACGPTYRFVNDVTAAGDLHLPYRAATLADDDCTRKLVNATAYDETVFVYTCPLPA